MHFLFVPIIISFNNHKTLTKFQKKHTNIDRIYGCFYSKFKTMFRQAKRGKQESKI